MLKTSNIKVKRFNFNLDFEYEEGNKKLKRDRGGSLNDKKAYLDLGAFDQTENKPRRSARRESTNSNIIRSNSLFSIVHLYPTLHSAENYNFNFEV